MIIFNTRVFLILSHKIGPINQFNVLKSTAIYLVLGVSKLVSKSVTEIVPK